MIAGCDAAFKNVKEGVSDARHSHPYELKDFYKSQVDTVIFEKAIFY